ncbi:uncharacterized protein LOC125543588 isoform X1 [Triticum urartu]|uniref:uncharacterized protein LOC125543588 isoform X1 n=1 Tax=Triticum urartu TaxID=4572 RepID=UPI0020446D1D|nr:uncharacterized protein LOC125543588 isoform X1 [Triticum urartu]
MAPRTPQWLFRGNAVFPAEGGTHARPRAPGSASTGATNGQRLDRRLCPARQSGQNEKEQRLWISIDSRIEGLNNERQWIPIDSLMKKEKGKTSMLKRTRLQTQLPRRKATSSLKSPRKRSLHHKIQKRLVIGPARPNELY